MMRGCSAVRCAPSKSVGACRISTRSTCSQVRSPGTSDGQRSLYYWASFPYSSLKPPSWMPCLRHTRLRSCLGARYSTKPSSGINLSDNLPEQFRSVMRVLTHPVVVLTAHDGSHPRAMTMSSLTSLTLTPTPLVTFNVATPSRTLDALSHDPDRSFNIHILAGTEEGAGVAGRFTKGNIDGLFDGVEYDGAEDESPILVGEGVLCALRCKLAKSEAPMGGLMRVRDHMVVVAEVVEVIPGGGGDSYGLAYTDRQHRCVGSIIKCP